MFKWLKQLFCGIFRQHNGIWLFHENDGKIYSRCNNCGKKKEVKQNELLIFKDKI
jgi:hypothetical protein